MLGEKTTVEAEGFQCSNSKSEFMTVRKVALRGNLTFEIKNDETDNYGSYESLSVELNKEQAARLVTF